MGKTTIEWTAGDDGMAGKTWNPVRGCHKISPGCKNCYAEAFAERWRGVVQPNGKLHVYHDGFDPRTAPDKLSEPLGWRKPCRIFVNSMSDLFLEDFSDEYIAAVFGVMAACPQHTFQVLTKRAERMRQWFQWAEKHGPDCGTTPTFAFADLYGVRGVTVEAVRPGAWPLPNVWLGVSVEDQKYADERIPHLLETPAAARFVSYEPALGPVDFGHWLDVLRCVHGREPRTRCEDGCNENSLSWVIVGGESGPGARPFDLAWARSTVRQCRAADVPVFVKQLGARPFVSPTHDGATGYDVRLLSKKGGDMSEWPEDLRVRQFPRAPGDWLEHQP